MLAGTVRNTLVAILCLSLSGVLLPTSAVARMIGTTEYLEDQQRQAHIERINGALTRDIVRAQLTALGVDPEYAKQRVAHLTDDELLMLDQRLQELPAGGGALELVLVVFLVLLILDLTGITNVFPTIGPGNVR
ncbi:MAG: PA2779 family protein [Gammaproteobacteria bacterium]|jgi:hypothetical protein|nr:MAG: PA2779 family protein [Gammaproteobacteria bacterium]